ncbi:MAG: hypothetical protein Q9226_007568 [Calogaya cf. arnoldii]
MGRMLQKKKNRSSVPRATRKPKSKRRPMKTSSIIAANWDKHLTLSQNYHRLGLASRLNSSSGGTEAKATQTEDVKGEQPRKEDLLDVTASRPATIELKTTKVLRDAEGNIVKAIQKAKPANPLHDPLNAMEEERDGENTFDASNRPNKDRMNHAGSFPLAGLVEVANRKKPRKQSQREQEWIERLVEKHGQDIRSMNKDPKFNQNQQTEADIRRRIEVWRKSR